jgi:hypothetical protein
MRLAACLVTAAGLVVLVIGVADAAPLAFFGTAAERAGMAAGRRVALAGAVVLVVAAVLFAARGDAVRAVLVAAPGVVCVALLYAFPRASYVWPALLVLGPVAAGAAITALLDRG